MKKAKFVLPAIGLLSVIAGALAFKSQHRFSTKYACYTTSSATPIFLGNKYTTTDPQFTLLCTLANPVGAYARVQVKRNGE